jgi:D-lactate dehydrogenase
LHQRIDNVPYTMATHILARTSALPRAAILSSLQKTHQPHAFPLSTSANLASATPAANSDRTNGTPNLSIKLSTALAIAGASLLGGYCLGTSHSEHWTELQKSRELPKGERGCCSCEGATNDGANTGPSKITSDLTEAQAALSSKLQKIVGKDHVLDAMTESSKNAQFLKGARLGHGTALCIVQPGTVRQAVQCLQEIVDAGCVVLPQGRNTGLTGG